MDRPKSTTNVLKMFMAEQHIIMAKYKGEVYKLFQILFGSDGSLYVNFPYYKYKTGLCSVVTHKGGEATATVDLKEGGKVTSHLVKFSCHPDGNVHFSQTNKILASIKKKSVPMGGDLSHLFTIHIKGVSSFSAMDKPVKQSEKKMYLSVDLKESMIDSLKFVGRIYSIEDAVKIFSGGNQGPIVKCMLPNGKGCLGWLLSFPNFYRVKRYILLLTCEEDKVDGKEGTYLMFIGGFDSKQTINNRSAETKFLSMMYPLDNYDELKKELGSIDL